MSYIVISSDDCRILWRGKLAHFPQQEDCCYSSRRGAHRAAARAGLFAYSVVDSARVVWFARGPVVVPPGHPHRPGRVAARIISNVKALPPYDFESALRKVKADIEFRNQDTGCFTYARPCGAFTPVLALALVEWGEQ